MSNAVSEPVQAVQPDWEMAKILVAQGIPTRTITAQCNLPSIEALQKRIQRGGWSRLRTDLIKAVSVTISQSKQNNRGCDEVTEDGALVRGRLSKGLVRATDGMDTLPAPKSLSARANHGKLVKDIADAAKLVYGWDQSSSTVFDFTLHESMQVEDKGNLVATGESVIEIPQQTESEQRLLKPADTAEQPPTGS